ncbi:uncharacterized protein LOC117179583 isoform X2 [Belonocnema kinseyi]|uniref:uncharacterized protein LOC117179583 isoform X2 n=1 Tax=Belonocnema kinseyi TaxID=2817044 RepID=UPI00143CC0D3|nr:uncharacterized protein LOC117179583 isoform X2 [Belonocnema kinseyi]
MDLDLTKENRLASKPSTSLIVSEQDATAEKEVEEEGTSFNNIEYEECDFDYADVKIEYDASGYSHADSFVDVSETVTNSQDPLLLNDPLSLITNGEEKKEISDNNLGDDKSSKKWTILPYCNQQCHVRVTKPQQKNLFNRYCLEKTYDSRLRFVEGMIQTNDQCNIPKFYLTSPASRPKEMCKKCLGITLNESEHFLDIAYAQWSFTYKNSLQSRNETLKPGTESSLKRRHVSDSVEQPCKIRAYSPTETIKLKEGDLDIEYIKVEAQSSTEVNLDAGPVDVHKISKNSDNEVTHDNWTPLPRCGRKCHMLVKEEVQKSIYSSYWRNPATNLRVDFLNKMTKMELETRFSPPIYVAKYYLDTEKSRQEVCRECFRHVLDEKDYFITTVLEKKMLEINERMSSYSLFGENSQITRQYVTANKKTDVSLVPKDPASGLMRVGSIIQCSFNCCLRINEDEQKQIFNDYWKNATYKSRFDFVRSVIEFQSNQAHFYLNTRNSRKEVCRRCFRQILGESNCMITDIVEKKFESLRVREKPNTTIPAIVGPGVTKQTHLDNRSVEFGIIQNVEQESAKLSSLITQDLYLPKLDEKEKGATGQKERKEYQQKFVDLSKTLTSTGNEASENPLLAETRLPVEEDDILIIEEKCTDSGTKGQKKKVNEKESTPGENKKKKNDESCNSSRDIEPFIGWKELPACAKNCHMRLKSKDLVFAFNKYWFNTTNEERFDLLCNMLDVIERPQSKNAYDVNAYLNTDEGRKTVCRQCFNLILEEDHKFILSVIQHKLLKIENVKKGTIESRKEDSNVKSANSQNEIIQHSQDESVSQSKSAKPIINARKAKRKSAKSCDKYCLEMVKKPEKFNILQMYWHQATENSRFKFVSRLTEIVKSPQGQYIANFYVNVDNSRLKVCKDCFAVFLHERTDFVEMVLQRKLREIRKMEQKTEVSINVDKTNVDKSARHSFLIDIEGMPTHIGSRDNLTIQKTNVESQSGNHSKSPNIKEHKKGNTVFRNSTTNCGRKCLSFIYKHDQKRIFNTYRHSNAASKLHYVNSMTELVQSPVSRREYDTRFYLDTKGGPRKVCKDCFLYVLGEKDELIESVFMQKLRDIKKAKEKTPVIIELEEEDVTIESAIKQTDIASGSAQVSEVIKNPQGESVHQPKVSKINTISKEAEKSEKNTILSSLLQPKRIEQRIAYSNKARETNSVKNIRGPIIWSPLPVCEQGCKFLIKEDEQKRIYDAHWLGATAESRFNFIIRFNFMKEMMTVFENPKSSVCKYNYRFHLNVEKGRQEVCRDCFQCILGETNDFIASVMEDKLAEYRKTEKEAREVPITIESQSEGLDVENPVYDPLALTNIPSSTSQIQLAQHTSRNWSPLPLCDQLCRFHVREKQHKRIYNAHWLGTTEESRFNLMKKMITVLEKPKSMLEYRYRFHIILNEGRQEVCRDCFQRILGETNDVVVSVMEQKLAEFRMEQKAKETVEQKTKETVEQKTKEIVEQKAKEIVEQKSKEIVEEKMKEIEPVKIEPEEKVLEVESFVTDPLTASVSPGPNLDNGLVELSGIVQETVSLITNLQEKQLTPFPDIVTLPKPWSPLISCPEKCNSLVNENEQKRMYDTYWLESTEESRFSFVNDMVDMVENPCKMHWMEFKFHINVDKGRQEVCRDCFIRTIADSNDFVTKVLEYKVRNSSCVPSDSLRESLPLKTSRELPEDVVEPDLRDKMNGEEKTSDLYILPISIESLEPGQDVENIVTSSSVSKNEQRSLAQETILGTMLDSEFIQVSEIEEAPVALRTIIEERKVIPLRKRRDKGDKPLDSSIICKPERPWIPLISCDAECNSLIKEDEQKRIYDTYWLGATEESRFKFINDMVDMVESEDRINRVKFKYYLDVDEGHQKVCRLCFCHAIAESNDFLTMVLERRVRKPDSMNEEILPDVGRKFVRKILPLKRKKRNNHPEAVLQPKLGKQKKSENSEEKNPQERKKQTSEIQLIREAHSESSNVDPSSPKKVTELEKSNDEKFQRRKRKMSSEIELIEEADSECSNVEPSSLQKEKDEKLQRNNRKMSSEIELVEEADSESSNVDPFSLQKEKELEKSEDIVVTIKADFESLNDDDSLYDKETDSGQLYICLNSVFNKKECSLEIPKNYQKQNIDSYQQQRTFQEKFDFINDRVKSVTTSSPGVSNKEHENKNLVANYYLKMEQGRQEVCSVCFQHMFKNSEYLIKAVFEKRYYEHGKIIEEQISKTPLCESHHYNILSSEKYLPIGLTFETMYDLYKNQVDDPLSFNIYLQVLALFNLKDKPKSLGNCKKCDTAMGTNKITDIETLHTLDASNAEKRKSHDEKAALSINSLVVCSFGFQQSLPTPHSSDSKAFYKHPLWTFNFTIYQVSGLDKLERKPTCYMWDETQGKKTANEIASCVYDYLRNLPVEVKHVIFYSNSCCGECRSTTIARAILHVLANHKTLEIVEHKFLVDGHSEMEKNLADVYLEIMNTNCGKILEPKDWYDAFGKKESQVVVMTKEMLYDFESMWQKKTSYFEEDIKWLQYTKQGLVYYKENWQEYESFKVLNLIGYSDIKYCGQPCNLGGFPIAKEKKKDLLDVLQLMPSVDPNVTKFYEQLPVENEGIEKIEILEHEIKVEED